MLLADCLAPHISLHLALQTHARKDCLACRHHRPPAAGRPEQAIQVLPSSHFPLPPAGCSLLKCATAKHHNTVQEWNLPAGGQSAQDVPQHSYARLWGGAEAPNPYGHLCAVSRVHRRLLHQGAAGWSGHGRTWQLRMGLWACLHACCCDYALSAWLTMQSMPERSRCDRALAA